MFCIRIIVWIIYTCAHILDTGLRIPVDLHLRDTDLFQQYMYLICKLFIYLFIYLFVHLIVCIYCIYLFICFNKLVKFKLRGCFSLYLCCLVTLARNR